MKNRYLEESVDNLCLMDHKMCFVSGPRQCGKTTFAKMLSSKRALHRYYNWDDVSFRRIWVKTPSELIPLGNGRDVPIVVFDEIHKEKLWKRKIKGIYDTLSDPCDIVVTGSARLSIYKKGSDSLLGRYFHFRLHPFSIRELSNARPVLPDDILGNIFSRTFDYKKQSQEILFRQLMQFGPFPEPFLLQHTQKARLWQKSRREIIIREDIRDISRIPDLSKIELMSALLPEKVGSLFSLNSVREDLEVSYDTVKRWLTYLKELYYIFEIKPYHKSIPRALKKEGKIYFWDYSEVPDESARFENLVASHLLKACHYWTDTGEGSFDLLYLRNKEKKEIDFLITRDGNPWLPVEVKLNDTNISSSWQPFLKSIQCEYGLQIVSKPHWEVKKIGNAQILVAGAGEILNYFV